MIPLLITIVFVFSQAMVGQDASDARKKEFIAVLKTLPTKGEFYTEEAIRKAGPYLPVLLSLTEKDTKEYDFHALAALSSGLARDAKHRAYVLANFAAIRLPELKLLWAALLFGTDEVSPEVVRYLRDALNHPQHARLLSGMMGPDFKFFKQKVRRHPYYANEGGAKSAQQPKEDEGHADWVSSVAFSPDGKVIVSGSHDGTLILWEITTGKQLRSIEDHRLHGRPFEIVSVTFSPDGKMLASASSDKTVRLWNASTGAQVRVFADLKFAKEVKFSRDGTLLAAANCETVLVWNVTTGSLIHTFRKSLNDIGGSYCASHVEFSPDGKKVIADGGPIQTWDVSSGSEVQRFESQGSGLGMALSTDGRQLLLGEDFKGGGGMIELWDVARSTLLRRFPRQPTSVECVAIAPDGKTAASESHEENDIGSRGFIKLWKMTTGAELRKLAGHTRRVAAIAFAPDGKTIASGSWDHSVKLWDVTTGKELRTFPMPTK